MRDTVPAGAGTRAAPRQPPTGTTARPLAAFLWRRKWPWVAFLLVGVLYAIAARVMYVNQERMIFPGAERPRVDAPGPSEPGVEQVWITSDDGCRVEAWFELGRGRTARSPGPAVMYFHGNADLVDTAWWIAPYYTREGISIMVPEYRGYGRADGHPSQQAIVADAVRFHDWLAARPEVDSRRIILHGASLGGGVAAALADQRRPAALILECTFTSMEAMSHRYWMPGFLCRHPFRTDRVLPRLDIPIAILHGRNDNVISVSHGRRLHALAPQSRYVELDCGHNDYHNDWDNVRSFLVDAGLIARP